VKNNESELTRRYLLNSHSRGSLEEVVSEVDSLEFGDEEELQSGAEPWSNQQFMQEWDGRDTTQSFFLKSYE
jgi:hypothetical protein